MREIKHGNISNSLICKRLTNLKKLISILDNSDNDFQRAIEFRRVYPTYDKFMQAYYLRNRFNADKTARIIEPQTVYADYQDKIDTLRDLYKQYEENGLFELAKQEDAFLISDEGNYDSRFAVKAYIYDPESYDMELFCKKHGINKNLFSRCVTKVKNNSPELYNKYVEKFECNKTTRIAVPVNRIYSIVEGIKTGKTSTGEEFDIYEFYKLVPFKFKNFDLEIRQMSENEPKLLQIKSYKQMNHIEGRTNSFADNIYFFAKCTLNEEKADLLRDWMKENNVRNLTPIHRASTVNCYANGSKESYFSMDDADELFDIMKDRDYPEIYEIYNLLKKERIEKNKKNSLIKLQLKKDE